MFYPDSVLEEVRSLNDIVSVISQYSRLTQKGGNYFGLCPFHNEKTPSFSVSPDKQLYHCFGCGASGNVVTFVMQKENYDFVEAIKHLADRANYRLPEASQSRDYIEQRELKDKLYEIHTKAARFYYDILVSEKGQKAVAYLDGRGVAEPVRRRFGLGYSGGERGALYRYLSSVGYSDELLQKSGLVIPDKKGGFYDRFFDRLMFPIFDAQGKIIGFGGRILDKGEPKYLNSPETIIFNKSKNLYGINYARQSKARAIILVEGYMDVIAMHQNGFANSVASLGTAFNADHAGVLNKYCDNVVLLFDSDEAGEKAVLRTVPVLSRAGLNMRVLQLRDAKDPDEFLKRRGREAFAEALKSAEPAVSFQIKCLKKKFDLSDNIEKTRFTNEASVIIAGITNSIERDIYAKELSALADVSLNAINAELGKLVNKKLDEIKDFKYKNKPVKYSSDKLEKKRDEARRGVLSAIASSKTLAERIAIHVKCEEFVITEYMELYNLLYGIYSENKTVIPADIISRFDTVESQKFVSAVFSQKPGYDSDAGILDMINQQITCLKREYIEYCMSELSESINSEPLSEEKQTEFDEKANFLLKERIKLDQLVSNNHKWLK